MLNAITHPKRDTKFLLEHFRSGAVGVYVATKQRLFCADMPPVEDPAITARRMKAESTSARFYGHNVGSPPSSFVALYIPIVIRIA